MGHNIRNKLCPISITYLEYGNSRFLSGLFRPVRFVRISKRVNSLVMFHPARFRDRRPELSLPSRDKNRCSGCPFRAGHSQAWSELCPWFPLGIFNPGHLACLSCYAPWVYPSHLIEGLWSGLNASGRSILKPSRFPQWFRLTSPCAAVILTSESHWHPGSCCPSVYDSTTHPSLLQARVTSTICVRCGPWPGLTSLPWN